MATRNLARMDDVMRDCDLVILSGDLTNFGGPAETRKVLDDVRASCANVLALPGNLDQREVIPYLEQEGIALHGRGRVVDGVGIFGCGGSNISPFGTPTELTEDEIYEKLRAGYEMVRDAIDYAAAAMQRDPFRFEIRYNFALIEIARQREHVLTRSAHVVEHFAGLGWSAEVGQITRQDHEIAITHHVIHAREIAGCHVYVAKRDYFHRIDTPGFRARRSTIQVIDFSAPIVGADA
jgi:hypothetical protein